MFEKQNVELGITLQKRDEQLSSIWHNPIFLIGVGLAAGTVTGVLLSK